MQQKIYSIRDSKGQLYNVPLFARTHGEAERIFSELAHDPKTTVAKYPEDFDLYYIGVFDDDTGLIEPQDTPQHIVKAISFKTAKN